MSNNPEERRNGFNQGVRACIAWLHAEAGKMNDPHAQGVLNSAAFHLGTRKPDIAFSHADEAEWRPTHRHVKRGSEYQVIAFGELQTTDPIPDETPVTIYLAGNGAYYVRPTAEFEDGRFEVLPPKEPTDGR